MERKNLYAEVAKTYGDNEFSIREIAKKKETRSSFAVSAQTAEVAATVRDKGLVKMKRCHICVWMTWTENVSPLMMVSRDRKLRTCVTV